VNGLSVAEILQVADRIFPFNQAEPWDNCGLQIGNLERTVDAVAFSLDPSFKAIEFSAGHSCSLLVTHHPVLLEPVRNLVSADYSSAILIAAVRAQVDIMSLHTNLDAAPGGLNDHLAETIGLQDTMVPLRASCARFGRLPIPVPVYELASRLADTLNCSCPRIVADGNRLVESVFCASGSGMGYWSEALRCRADVVVTGDIRYHAAVEAFEKGIALIDAGHFALEKAAPLIMGVAFEREFELMGREITCHICELEKDPFLDIYHL